MTHLTHNSGAGILFRLHSNEHGHMQAVQMQAVVWRISKSNGPQPGSMS